MPEIREDGQDVQFILDLVISVSSEKKASFLQYYDVSEKIWVTDYIVLVGVSNKIHGGAIYDALSKKLKEEMISLESPSFFDSIRYSGSIDSGWLILDLNSIVVHLCTQSIMDTYELDKLFEKSGVVYHC